MIEQKATKTCIIIPARMNSLRYPKKVMLNLFGYPMIEHVYKRACLALDSPHIYIASQDSEILEYMQSIGANVIKSESIHDEGTSRAAEAASLLNYENVIVLQADEILIDPSHLVKLLGSIEKYSSYTAWNLVTKLSSISEIDDTNIVKCATNCLNEIFFIFRKNPFISTEFQIFKKIMGVVAFKREYLISLSTKPNSMLQIANSTEQLKILEYGDKIREVEVDCSYPSINSPTDVTLVIDYINKSKIQRKILDEYV